MTVSPSLQPPAVAWVHIITSHRGVQVPWCGEQVITQPGSQTAHDLADHEGPGALRKPILFLSLYQACLLPSIREGGGGHRRRGREGRYRVREAISFINQITSLIINASILFYLPRTGEHL